LANAAEKAPEPLQGVLARLVELHALSELERDRASFLEEGYFEPSKSKAIRGQVNQLCSEVRPEARALVRAFRIPEPLLEPTIGRR
jgi:acyl-CoA oxidase